jgi:RNA polymerase sigma factor (sigma-70 family)
MTDQQFFDEAALLTRLMQDDRDAFDGLYWHYQKAVFQNVLKITRDVSSTEDIVQEVFINLWEKRHSVGQSQTVGGWLFVSSYNRAINALKKKLRTSLVLKDLALMSSTDDSLHDISSLQLMVMGKAIATLSPRKKQVFELCKLQGKTYEEAALELQLSKHTVKEYLAEAMLIIREYIKNHPEFTSGTMAMMMAMFS